MKEFVEGKNSEVKIKIASINELDKLSESKELNGKEKLRAEFYEKRCCYKEGFLGYIQEMIVIAFINIFFIGISIALNKNILSKNNNYINLVKNSSNSLTNFEKFWCNAGNNEFKALIIYLVFLVIFIFFFIFSLLYAYKKRIPLNIDTIIYNKKKIIAIYFSLYIIFYIFFSVINYLIVYSIIFISISPIEYPGVFNIADTSKELTLDEEIEIEDAVEEFKKSKHIHIIYIIISFIILYLNILITKLIYKSIILVLEKAEKKNKEDQEEQENSKKDKNTKKEINKSEQQKTQKKEKEYNWKYPDINKEFKILEGFYLELFLILHLTIPLFKLNIEEEENYQELLFTVEENKMETPKYYSILMNYGIFEISVTILIFLLNLICFAIIIILMFNKMLYDKIQQFFKSLKSKIILLILNIIHSIFVMLLIIFSGLCLSALNDLDENDNLNYFVVKKKLIGQIIVNSFILVFLVIIIIDNSRRISFRYCKKESNKKDSQTDAEKSKKNQYKGKKKDITGDNISSTREIIRSKNDITNQ